MKRMFFSWVLLLSPVLGGCDSLPGACNAECQQQVAERAVAAYAENHPAQPTQAGQPVDLSAGEPAETPAGQASESTAADSPSADGEAVDASLEGAADDTNGLEEVRFTNEFVTCADMEHLEYPYLRGGVPVATSREIAADIVRGICRPDDGEEALPPVGCAERRGYRVCYRTRLIRDR